MINIVSDPRLVEAKARYRADLEDNLNEICTARRWDTVRTPGDADLLTASEGEKALTRAEEVELQKEIWGGINWFSHMDHVEELMQAFSQVLYKRVYDEIALDNPIPLFYDMYTQTDLDAQLEIHDAYGGRVYPWSYGARRLTSAWKEKFWKVLFSQWQLGYRIPVHQIQTGRVLLSEIAREAAKKILAHKVKQAMDAMASAYTSSGSYTINGGASDLSQTNLNAALRAIRNLTEVRAVVGCHSAVQPIYALAGYDKPSNTDGTGFPDSVKMEIHRTGKIAQYAGANVVPLKMYTDPLYSTTVYTEADVYVVPTDDKKTYNVFAEHGTTEAEPLVRDAGSKNVFIYFYWEDAAYVNSAKIKYGRRIRNNATS